MIMSAEDDYARVLRPKLDAMGADLNRVFFFPLLGEEQHERLANIVADIGEIERLCREVSADFLFIDPLFSHIGGDVQTGVDNQVRAALAPLLQMARRLDMAVLATRHTTKQKHLNSKHMGGGSVGISALVRINWLVGPDPLDSTPEQHVLTMNKINLARRPESLLYEIRSDAMHPDVAVARWRGETSVSAYDVNRAANAETGTRAVKRDAAAEFLVEILAKGPRPSKEVEEEAKEVHGIGRTTLWVAKEDLGIEAFKPKGVKDGRWMWQLPETPPTEEDESGDREESGALKDERTLPSNGTLNIHIEAKNQPLREEFGPAGETEPFTVLEESARPACIDTPPSPTCEGCGGPVPYDGAKCSD